MKAVVIAVLPHGAMESVIPFWARLEDGRVVLAAGDARPMHAVIAALADGETVHTELDEWQVLATVGGGR